jgi:hypothetical protein
MKKLLLATLIITLPVIYFSSCKKDKGDPPIPPPYESMVIDFSNFSSQKKSGGLSSDTKGTESSTWQFAAGIAGVWNDLISLNLEIPLASYEAVSDNNPSYVSEHLWQWSYDFIVDGVNYKAKLKGDITTNSVSWKMYITKDVSGGYTDFLWIEGTSKNDGSGGQWNFQQNPQTALQLFRTDWTKSGDQVSTVKYTYVKNDTNKDSFINYYTITTSNFDVGYNIHFSDGLYSDSEIEWNINTFDGRLKCVDYLQDENWYCWDSNKINKVCD